MMIPLYDVKGKIFAEQKLGWWQFPLKLLLNFHMENFSWKNIFGNVYFETVSSLNAGF